MSFFADANGCQNKYALVQYWFDGPPVKIKVKPHGNSSSSHPYFRVAASARAQHREIAAKSTPKSALQIATCKQGGELEARGFNMLPRNVQEMKNFRRSEHKKDTNVLYSVMLQCKLSEGKADAFVRDVKAAPEPQCVLFSDWQLNDLSRLVTNPDQFSIFSADTTYNLGDFYVTPTTYQHLMLEDTTTMKHPHFLGPILVHQRKNFSAFNYLASTLIGHCKKLRDVQAFGTDGDPALIEALSHNFNSSKQLRCFIHLKRNIAEKLKERGIANPDAQEFLADIFGKHCGTTYQEGLVDSNNQEDFESRLENCRSAWIAREARYQREGQITFYAYFCTYYASIISHTMLKDLRVAVGLGCPPRIYTTNASESVNAVIKRKVQYKETEWPDFNNHLKEIVDRQREDVIRALSGRGQYRLCEQYKHLQVHPQEWVQMTPDQRKRLLKQFDNASLRKSKDSEMPATSSRLSISSSIQAKSCHTSTPSFISIAYDESGIISLPLTTVESIWSKAEEYLESDHEIVPAPGSDLRAKMVSSRSSSTPHFVRPLSSGQYVCDSNCLQWKSAQICSHIIAVAEKNSELHSFLEWYNTTKQQPNITTLAVHGLPAGRGRKGGIPKRQRSKSVNAQDTVVPRPATCKRISSSTTQMSNRFPRGPKVGTSSSLRLNGDGHSAPPTMTDTSCPLHSDATHSVVSDNVVGASSYNVFQSPPNMLSAATTIQPFNVSQSASGISAVASSIGSFLSQNQVITVQPPTNTNPFFMRAIEGNIRMCQGCRTSLRNVDGTIPMAPYDFAIARFERRSYRDKNGQLQTPMREQAVHYHLKLACVMAVCPNFVPSTLVIPTDTMAKLNTTHKEYVRLVFGLSFQ